MVVQLKDHLVALLEEQNRRISFLQQAIDHSQRVVETHNEMIKRQRTRITVLETHNEMMKALVTRITDLETHNEAMKADLIDTQSDSGASGTSFNMIQGHQERMVDVWRDSDIDE